ncbi:MAG TPA: HWE histidine kinase domain-containing protein [Sphingomonas sp.]|nr:HWE histidine kinase domain-containing protein [Sphingomonas sp.]
MKASLDDLLVTGELAGRPSRAPDYEIEAAIIARLVQTAAERPGDALQCLTDAIVEAGVAESAGVSLRDAEAAEVRWQAVSGLWHRHLGRALPLDRTLSSAVIARDAALLFRDPARFFPQPAVKPPIDEILMAPVHARGEPVGTLWAASHSRTRRFEREDLRLLTRLAAVASVTCRMDRAANRAEAADDRVQAELSESRRRFRQLVEGIPQLLWRATDTGRWTWAGPQWTRFTGQSERDSHDYGWLDRVHPDDRRCARQAWGQTECAETFEVDYRVLSADGDYRWFQARAAPTRDEAGAIVEWLGASTDIDDLKRAREHHRVLVAELQHRARNTLGMVRSIARRTAENSDSVESFHMHFDGRIGAFARSQSLATGDPVLGVDLETLVAEELLVHHAHEGGQATIAGPPVRLKPKAADILGLALHELAVNAVKFGGLSSDAGRVEVVWTLDDSDDRPVLVLDWLDSAPDRPVARPRYQGFGSELIERSLRYELDAESQFNFNPDGVRCAIRVPLAKHIA